jgi:hypothetical protein
VWTLCPTRRRWGLRWGNWDRQCGRSKNTWLRHASITKRCTNSGNRITPEPKTTPQGKDRGKEDKDEEILHPQADGSYKKSKSKPWWAERVAGRLPILGEMVGSKITDLRTNFSAARAGGAGVALASADTTLMAINELYRLSHVMEEMGNKTISLKERMKMAASEIPILGEKIAALVDHTYRAVERTTYARSTSEEIGALFGIGAATDRLNEDKLRLFMHPFDAERKRNGSDEAARRRAIELEGRVGESDRIVRLEGAGAKANLMFSDTTFVGPFEPGDIRRGWQRFYEEDEFDDRMRAAKIASAEAQTEKRSAAQRKLIHKDQLRGAHGRHEDAFVNAERIGQDAIHKSDADWAGGADTVKGKMERARAETAITEAMRSQEAMMKSIEELRRSETDHAKAIRVAAERETDEKRVQLGIEKERLQLVKEGAKQFGTLDPMRQQGVLQVVKRAKQDGWGALDPVEKQLLLGTTITSKWASEKSEKSAINDPAFKELAKEVGLEDAKKLEETIFGLQKEIQLKFVIDEEKFKAALDKIDEKFAERMLKVIDPERLKNLLLDIKMRGARFAGGGGS